MFGFVDPEHLLGRGDSARKPHAFEILDLHGQVVNTWAAPKQWKVVDTSPDRHLLAVLSDQRAFKTLVVEYPSKKVILTKDNPYQELGTDQSAIFSDFFTEGGRTLCSVGSVEFQPARKDTFTQCWDVDSGKKIAQFDGFLGGAPAAASSHGSRLVLTSGFLFTKKKTEALRVVSYGQRVVWDFRSGKEVAAWDLPEFSSSTMSHGPELLRLAPVAVSSSGRYVAEAHGVLLRIYELP
jgi:WD40 repeat protein